MKISIDHNVCRALTLAVLNGGDIVSVEDSEKDWLGYRLDSGASKMNTMLVTGATRQELESARGGIDAHLHSLRTKHGLSVIRKGDYYIFDKAIIESQVSTKIDPVAETGTTMQRHKSFKTISTPLHAPATSSESPVKLQNRKVATQSSVNPTDSHLDKKFKLEVVKLVLEIVVVILAVIGSLYAIFK